VDRSYLERLIGHRSPRELTAVTGLVVRILVGCNEGELDWPIHKAWMIQGSRSGSLCGTACLRSGELL
jgi:hypothetical protein